MSDTSKTQSNPGLTVTARQLGVIVLLLLAAVGAAAYQNGWFTGEADANESDNAATQTILPVNTLQIHFVDSIEQTRGYTGTVRARRRSELAFEMAGKINQVLVDDGEHVEAGQVIAQLDTSTLMAKQEAMRAQLAQSKFVMSELDAGPRQQQIAAATAETTAAKSEYDNAKIRSKRREALAKSKAIPVEEYDQSKLDVKMAKARWQSAFERLSELKAGTRKEQLSAQKANVTQLEASVKEMEVAISKSNLVAPYAGTITKRYLDPGSIAQPASPVFMLVEQSNLEAWVGLPVSVAAQTKIGQQYSVVVGEESFDVTASAKIKELDVGTRTQAVLFEFTPEAAETVVSGQLCRIQITTEVATSGFWIPNTALARGVRGLSSLMKLVPDDDRPELYRIRRCDIEVIKTDSNRVLAKGTISEGDLVVSDGLHRISNGQLVSLAEVTSTALSDTTDSPSK